MQSNAPPWRHALFVCIDAGLCGLLICRPRWLYIPVLLIAIQGVLSHGMHAWLLWSHQKHIDWLSVLVLLYMPPLVWIALLNARDRIGDQ